MYLIAVSGGPDSMFLLEKHKKNKIVVAHVNYNARKTSKLDEEIVASYCKKFEIPFHKLNVKFNGKGNFQEWARIQRYNFFKSIYQKYDCDKLLTGHHKDDLIETVLMQQNRNRKPEYWGMRQRVNLFDMNIERPFLHKYYKSEILSKIKIKFAIDESNFTNDYERNRVRKNIEEWTRDKKELFILTIKKQNKILEKKWKIVNSYVQNITNNDYDLRTFRSINKYLPEVLFKILNKEFSQPKLSTDKIKSIVDFINNMDGDKYYIIGKGKKLHKLNGKLLFVRNNI